jgi:hypothetical protein
MPNNYLSDADTCSALQSLATALDNDPKLHDTLLGLLPKGEIIQELLLHFNESRAAAAGNDPDQVLILEGHRKKLNRTLNRYEHLAKLAAEDDPTLPQKLGITLHKAKKTARSTATILAPGNLSVRHGSVHGVILANTSTVKRARSYLVEICEGDPSIESNWRFAATSAGCTKMEVTGLTPGTVYWFRVKAIGANGAGPWSSYVSLMAI